MCLLPTNYVYKLCERKKLFDFIKARRQKIRYPQNVKVPKGFNAISNKVKEIGEFHFKSEATDMKEEGFEDEEVMEVH